MTAVTFPLAREKFADYLISIDAEMSLELFAAKWSEAYAAGQIKGSPLREDLFKNYWKGARKNAGIVVARAPGAARPRGPQKMRLDRSALKVASPVSDKTVEELADIKAKNLARLKAVASKYQPAKKVANGPDIETDLEQSFRAPAFLSADDVKSML